jgi:transcriptional regulator with XRE-family HTH domain
MISERLKTARLRAGLSQEKLGKLAGIDPTSASARMNQYERGKHAPDYRLMCKVAEILNMPVSWFYTEDDDLARLQELYFHMSSEVKQNLLERAEEVVDDGAAMTN